MQESYYSIKGNFRLDVIDKQSNHVVDTYEEHNMIMTPARKSMSEIFANLTGVKYANKFGLGTMGCQDSSKYLPRDEYTGFEKSRDRLFCEASVPYSVGDVIPVILYGDIITIRKEDKLLPKKADAVEELSDKIVGSWMAKTGVQGSFAVESTGDGTWSSTDGAAGTVKFTVTQQPDVPDAGEDPDNPDSSDEEYLYYQYLGDREVEYVITEDQLANTGKFRVISELPYVYYTHFELPGYNVSEPSTEWNTDKTSLDAISVQQKDTSVIFTFIIDQDSGNKQHDNDPMFINPTSEFNEAAIYVNDRVFCMKTFPTKVKDNSVKFKITWTITF